MTIGVETSALNNRSTGTSRYITCLIEQLQTFDDNIKLFSSLDSGINFQLKRKGLEKFLYRNFYLRKEMTEQKVDYAFFPDYFMPSNFTIPSAIVIHDLSFLSHPHFYSKSFVSFYEYQLKTTLKNNPLILTISENTRLAISKYLNIRKENVHLLQAYSEFGYENFERTNGNYLLYVGHIEPRKNLHFLIKTFLKWKEITKADLKLIIAGEFWLKTTETKNILNEFKDYSSIQFTGYVDEDKLKKLYSNASGFVHTSFVEGFCLPVLEAMHYKLPIICSSNTGAEEISRPFSIIINPYSEKSLLNGFDELFEFINTKGRINYEIKYSPFLMRKQLAEVVEILKSKINNKVLISVPKAVNQEAAVVKTLLYSGLFNSGIKKERLHQSIFDIKMDEEEMESVLLKLYLQNKIHFKNGSVFLNYSLSLNNKSKKISNHSKNKKALRLLDFIPFISSASLSGGTVHCGYENHNDIDLFIITKPNALYIVYALIHVLSLLFRVRKELCANYLIDERGMEIKYPHDFYTAHQIISLKAIKNKELLNGFFNQNNWIKEYFPNFSWQKFDLNKPVKNIFLAPLNNVIKLFYRIIYRKKLLESKNNNSIRLEELCIKLHTNDNRSRITEEFFRAMQNYKAGTIILPENKHFKERIAVQ
jgi:glycosyltransferase involved in cell wall biosynthesis